MYRTSNQPDIIYPGKEIDPKINWIDFFPYDEQHLCPACTAGNKYINYTSEDGKESQRRSKKSIGCIGKKSFWFGKWLCPQIPHLHIKCWACKLKFIMWAQTA